MNDYKELIKRLRVAVDMHEAKGCVLEISAETCTEIADAIEQLVKERDKLKLDLCEANDVIEFANGKLKEAEKERDAAISQICQGCDNCKYRDAKIGEPCISCSTYRVGGDFIKSKWEWRGVQE